MVSVANVVCSLCHMFGMWHVARVSYCLRGDKQNTYITYFSAAMITTPQPKQFKEESLLWLTTPEGEESAVDV